MKYPQLVSMPSAVSDWLEEQLEARGLDAVIYARYILSLLHSETVDVIRPEEDNHFSHLKKEVRRPGAGFGRFSRASEWWKYSQQVDVEQLKRSAVVECLLSATDQNGEIESLVDELCKKLEEIKSEKSLPVISSSENAELQVSPQELAEKYYAAFPPLRRTCTTSPSKVFLFPKWIASPKKHNLKHKRSSSYESQLRRKVEVETMKGKNNAKQRLGYFSRKKDLSICRTVAKSVDRADNIGDIDLCVYNNANNQNKHSKWSHQNESLSNNLSSSKQEQDHCFNEIVDSWNHDEEMNMYEDLPVDIKELLDSPSPQNNAVEMMNVSNMRDTGKRGFISCGTDVMNSIWSNKEVVDNTAYDNMYNTALDSFTSETMLDFKFSSISINNNVKEQWPMIGGGSANQNTAHIYAGHEKPLVLDMFNVFAPCNEDWKLTKREFTTFNHIDNDLINRITASLAKLNHTKDKSSFVQVTPSNHNNTYNPFSKSTALFRFNSFKNDTVHKEKDDLLTSDHSHFHPINNQVDNLKGQGQYADGATFLISNTLEKVPYKRSESGSLYLDTEFGKTRKYCEYKLEEADPLAQDFILRFCMYQNDKACQTDGDLCHVQDQTEVEELTTKSNCSGDLQSVEGETSEACKCTCNFNENNAMNTDNSKSNFNQCELHPCRPDSVMAEFFWKYDSKPCDKCNNNTISWNTDWNQASHFGNEWNNQGLRNIWNGGEVCHSCLSQNGGRPPPSLQQTQLREDISQDGDQLLSDISSLHKSYLDEIPVLEISCDISEYVATSDRKRRHSFIAAHVEEADLHNRSSWSFASRIEEDCIIQMSALPTLRSVTL